MNNSESLWKYNQTLNQFFYFAELQTHSILITILFQNTDSNYLCIAFSMEENY